MSGYSLQLKSKILIAEVESIGDTAFRLAFEKFQFFRDIEQQEMRLQVGSYDVAESRELEMAVFVGI